VEKYGRAIQATDDKIIRRMRIACWVTKVTDTHSDYKYLTLIAFSMAEIISCQCYVYIYIPYHVFLFSRIEKPIDSLNLYTALVRICNELNEFNMLRGV